MLLISTALTYKTNISSASSQHFFPIFFFQKTKNLFKSTDVRTWSPSIQQKSKCTLRTYTGTGSTTPSETTSPNQQTYMTTSRNPQANTSTSLNDGPHFCSEQVTRAALAQVGKKRKTRWGSFLQFFFLCLFARIVTQKQEPFLFFPWPSFQDEIIPFSFTLSFVLSQKSLLLFDFHPLIVRGQQFDDISFSSGHRLVNQPPPPASTAPSIYSPIFFFRLVRAVGVVDDQIAAVAATAAFAGESRWIFITSASYQFDWIRSLTSLPP